MEKNILINNIFFYLILNLNLYILNMEGIWLWM